MLGLSIIWFSTYFLHYDEKLVIGLPELTGVSLSPPLFLSLPPQQGYQQVKINSENLVIMDGFAFCYKNYNKKCVSVVTL
jgi:hypothetical protein